jgi:hypothetical protein
VNNAQVFKWTDIKDKKPPRDDYFLVTYIHEFGGHAVCEAMYEEHNDKWIESTAFGDRRTLNVIAWADEPEAYK